MSRLGALYTTRPTNLFFFNLKVNILREHNFKPWIILLEHSYCHIEFVTKWLPFGRWYFQINFHGWMLLFLYSNFIGIFPIGSIKNKLTLVQAMAWRRIGQWWHTCDESCELGTCFGLKNILRDHHRIFSNNHRKCFELSRDPISHPIYKSDMESLKI